MFLDRIKQTPISQRELTRSLFEQDILDWFMRKRESHVGKWQFSDSKYENDPVQGAMLWAQWKNDLHSNYYIDRNQKALVDRHADDIALLTGPTKILVELGPGESEAVKKYTLPFVHAYKNSIQSYVPVDICKTYVEGAIKTVRKVRNDLIFFPHTQDFLKNGVIYPDNHATTALCLGSTLGNFSAKKSSSSPTSLLVKELMLIKRNLSPGSYLIAGMDTNQDKSSILSSYDHPAHFAFEENLMHRIKRDLIPHDSGFMPDAWRYCMSWDARSYQLNHALECLEDQQFNIRGTEFFIKKGETFGVENSFKFPAGVFQQAAIHAGYEPLASYLDDDKRMALHVLRVVG